MSDARVHGPVYENRNISQTAPFIVLRRRRKIGQATLTQALPRTEFFFNYFYFYTQSLGTEADMLEGEPFLAAVGLPSWYKS